MADTLLGGGSGGYAKVPEHHGGVTVAEALKASGVETVFFLPGGHLAPVINGCTQQGIRVISTRHESSAVFMAEAQARITGRTGVAAVTAGPGFTNSVTGLANAQATGIPVVVLGGRTPLTLRGMGAVQDADQEAVARAVAKWVQSATSPAQLGTLVREALTQARNGRPGSAYLDLPTDVLTAEAPVYDGGAAPRTAAVADRGAIDEACRLLAAAEKPVVLTGAGAFYGAAGDALRAFTEATDIPVTTTSQSRGVLPDSHPNSLGSLLHGGVGVVLADVVLIVGSRFNGNLVFGRPPLFNENQTILMVDADPAAFGLNRAPDLAIAGDAARVLEQLTDGWAGESKKAWTQEVRSYVEMSLAHWDGEAEAEAAVGVHPGWLARETARVASEIDATFVIDGGDILGWGLAFARAERPGSVLFTSDALGTLGVGVPYAVAGPIVDPAHRTIALVGDGAFGLSAMEIETAAREGSAPVIVVSNNNSWGDVRYEESEWFGATAGTDISDARYDRLCEALGGYGERVEQAEDFRPALDRALASNVVSVIDVRTDPDRPNEILRNMGSLNLQ